MLMVTSLRAYVSHILAVFLKLKAVLKLKGKTKQFYNWRGKQNKTNITHKKNVFPKRKSRLWLIGTINQPLP